MGRYSLNTAVKGTLHSKMDIIFTFCGLPLNNTYPITLIKNVHTNNNH